MKFSSSILTFSLLALAASSPMPKKKAASTTSSPLTNSTATASSTAAASTAVAAAGSSILTPAPYNSISISGGTAGNAQTEANALFAKIDINNLAAVSASDLKIIKGTHDVAEKAETGAFNPAIAAASGSAATALQTEC